MKEMNSEGRWKQRDVSAATEDIVESSHSHSEFSEAVVARGFEFQAALACIGDIVSKEVVSLPLQDYPLLLVSSIHARERRPKPTMANHPSIAKAMRR
jgi:hypothetical protein